MMGNYGTRNSHPMTKEIRRRNRKENLAFRKLTSKQQKVYRAREKTAKDTIPTIVAFIKVFDLLKIKSPLELFSEYRYGCQDEITDFAKEYCPHIEMPDRGNTRKERKFIR